MSSVGAVKAAVSIAGSDPSGGAGIQVDLKVFQALGVYGMAVPTALTIQDTTRVHRVEPISGTTVSDQLRVATADIPPDAAKTGVLASVAQVEAVANWAATTSCPLVVDPVLISTSGATFAADDLRASLQRTLLPRATLVTPNLAEAAALTGRSVTTLDEMERAARAIGGVCESVLVKGGHLDGDPTDLLWHEGTTTPLTTSRIHTQAGHGTGCVLSAAITSRLALGDDVPTAVRFARQFLVHALERAPGFGAGHGPLGIGPWTESDAPLD